MTSYHEQSNPCASYQPGVSVHNDELGDNEDVFKEFMEGLLAVAGKKMGDCTNTGNGLMMEGDGGDMLD